MENGESWSRFRCNTNSTILQLGSKSVFVLLEEQGNKKRSETKNQTVPLLASFLVNFNKGQLVLLTVNGQLVLTTSVESTGARPMGNRVGMCATSPKSTIVFPFSWLAWEFKGVNYAGQRFYCSALEIWLVHKLLAHHTLLRLHDQVF